MRNNISDKIIIIDLEATCWKENTNYQRKQSEIIEIGICIVDVKKEEITNNQGILVKPFKSKISDFCEGLTSINQDIIDAKGITLGEACSILRDEYKTESFIWASYGEYDKNMLTNQCLKWGISYPMNEQHINIKKEFAKISRKSMGMVRALNFIGVKLEGVHHRGKDDAYNIAKILLWIFKNNDGNSR